MINIYSIKEVIEASNNILNRTKFKNKVVSIENSGSKQVEILKKNQSLDQKAVAFTVDDAYSSFYKIAWPVFRNHGIPVTLFISTDIIDKKTKG